MTESQLIFWLERMREPLMSPLFLLLLLHVLLFLDEGLLVPLLLLQRELLTLGIGA